MQISRCFLILLLIPALAGARVEDKRKPSTAKKNITLPSRKKFQPSMEKTGDLKSIDTQIRALNLVIKPEPNFEKKVELFLRRSQLQISAARTIGLKRTRLADMTAAEKRYLDAALKTLTGLVPHSQQKKQRLSVIYYLLGLVEYEYERYEKVRSYLNQAINFDLNNPLAPSMSLMVGELEYELDKYNDAIKSYQLLYKKMKPREKAIADYKTAWSYIGLEEMEKAKFYFVRVINTNGDQAFVDDSLKDLAFVTTQVNDDEAAIRYGTETFPDIKRRAKFFYHTLVFLIQRDKQKDRQAMFKELLAVETDPFQRARILALRVGYERKEVPTAPSLKAMTDLESHLTKMDKETRDKFFFQDGPLLEDNSEAIIKNFVGAQTGTLKIPESLSKPYILAALKKLIEIHIRIFPKSEKLAQIYGLWVDACYDSKDVPCLQSLKKTFRQLVAQQTDPYKNLYTVSSLKILTLVDENYVRNPSAHEEELLALIQEFIKEFPSHPDNIKLLSKATTLMLKKEKFKEALPQLLTLYKIEPSDDNLHKLLFSQFKLEQYQEVVENPAAQVSKSPKVIEVYREANLTLAEKSLKKDDLPNYEKYLKGFLATKPDKKKANLAQVDFLHRLVKVGRYEQFTKEWQATSPEMRDDKSFGDVRATALAAMITDGYFHDEPTLQVATNSRDHNFNVMTYQRALDKPFSKKDFDTVRGLPKQKRNYIYNLLVLTQPKTLINFLSSERKLDNDEKKVLFTAYLIQRGHDQFTFSANELGPIQSVVPARMIPSEKSKLFEDVAKINPPRQGMKAERYNREVEDLVYRIRLLRKKINREIGKVPVVDRIDLLDKVIDVERATAAAIRNSPMPAGLTEAQKYEYQAGLGDVAKEYDNQADDLARMKAEIVAKKQAEEEVMQSHRLLEIKPELLPDPSPPGAFVTAEELFKKSAISALVYWDAQFSAKKINEENYYKGRARLLVKVSNTQAMRDFIANELKAAGQEALIKKWKDTAG